MLNTKQFIEAIEALEQQGINREITIQALKEAFETIVKKKHIDGLPDLMVKVDILMDEGRIDIYNIKNVVEDVQDDALEISVEDAKEYLKDPKVGDQVFIKLELEDFSKQDAMKFKSILKQKIKEAEKSAILAMYSDKINELITGYVEKIEPKYTLVNLGRTSVVLHDKEKIGDEKFDIGQSIKVYLLGVGSSSESGIVISRACPGFLKRLFEEEIHDVYDGTVIIKDIVREAGERAKVAVTTNDINVDPVGACIGQGGSKIQKICNQINKEKIDVVQFHNHKGLYVAECLKPANVIGVKMNENGSAIAIVKDGDLRVAIGRRGVNARLAVKLAGCNIDIKEESVAKQENISFLTIDEMKKEEEQMIFEERRKALLEQIAREEEERKQKELEEANKPVEEKAEEVVEEVVEHPEETETIKIEEEKEVEPVQTKKEEVVEPVEFKPVILQSKVSLADLEKQIEEEKKKKSNQNNYSNKKKQEKVEKVEKTNNTQRMDIYTQEELDEMDEEEYYDDDYVDEDDDINYDDYDEYYDEK